MTVEARAVYTDAMAEATPLDPVVEPLAARMRPRVLDEFVGQGHILGDGRLLRRMIQADMLSSVILSGPPGCGKTTLARVIANHTAAHFITLNAVLSGVTQVREAIAEARRQRERHGRSTILFVDEVHRWNKAQQDALLPWVESGMLTLIGATTQNPFFEVIAALVSRSRIFQFKALEPADLLELARRTLQDHERGYGRYRVTFAENALQHLIDVADGDARSLLNAMQLAVETTPQRFPPATDEAIVVDLGIAEESIQQKALLYDKDGDYHFDSISAFIKSLRGSDPDAALYWMARMIAGGEDPRYLLRRMVILASEDVGLADPQALVVTTAAAAAFERVGMPEGQFHLAQAALYLAVAPKSNSALAYFDAVEAARRERRQEPPAHLKDASRDSQGFGHGEGYLYPHAYRDHWVAQTYLPAALQGRVFYNPTQQGWEAAIGEQVARRRELQLETMDTTCDSEAFSWSPSRLTSARWLARISETRTTLLRDVRRRLFEGLHVARHHCIVVAGDNVGMLLWEALRQAPEGGVWGWFGDTRGLEVARHYAQHLPVPQRPQLQAFDFGAAKALGEPAPKLRCERIIGFNTLTRCRERATLLTTFGACLDPQGWLVLAETIPQRCQRLSQLAERDPQLGEVATRLRAIEEQVVATGPHLLSGWDEENLATLIADCGFDDVTCDLQYYHDTRRLQEHDLQRWLLHGESEWTKAAARICSEEERRHICRSLVARFGEAPIEWRVAVAYLRGTRSRPA